MNSLPHPSQSRKTLCCSPTQAASWLDTLTEMALVYHDDGAALAIPLAAQHYLDALRQAGVPR